MNELSTVNIEKYATLVFDCDGVILNSNKVKTQAFYNAALPYGEKAAQELVNYHVENGGISRYKKFEIFLQQMVLKDVSGPCLNELLTTYAAEVRSGLLSCEVSSGLSQLRDKTHCANWLVVSGGDESELRQIFLERKLSHYFNSGIFGSPDTKDEIFRREIASGVIRHPAVFLGDSRYDLESSRRAGLDFIFISGWSEIRSPSRWIDSNNLITSDSLADL